jgi:tripartite ATP-independent transporter DctP family solute receptor
VPQLQGQGALKSAIAAVADFGQPALRSSNDGPAATGLATHGEETNMTAKIERRDFLKIGAAGAAATSLGLTPASAQAKVVLKASDVHPTGYPTVAAVEAMGKKLEAATNGRVSIQMFPSMQLGGEKEMIEQAQVGALQIARVSVGAIGPVVDDLNVFNMPFVFRDGAHMEKVIDGEIGTELLGKITSNDKTGLVGLCWMNAGTRNVYNSKKAIKSLDDLKGLKIRMMGNPLFVDTMNALGGNGIAMGFDQVYNAMQTGVVDGAENNFPSFIAQNHFQVAKFISQTEHLIIPEILVFSKKTWNTLSKEDQTLVAKVGREAQKEQRALWYKAEEESLAKMKAAGIEIIKFADKKAFQDAVKPVWDKYGAKYAALTKRIQDVK